MTKKAVPTIYTIETLRLCKKPVKHFEMIRLENFIKDMAHLEQPHRHSFFWLMIPEAGTGEHTIDLKDYEIKPQRIFLINYGQVHSWKWVKNLSGYLVLFTKEFYNLIFTNNEKIKSDAILKSFRPFIDVTPNDFTDWEHTLKMIDKEKDLSGTNSRELVCLLLKTCMLRYTKLAAKPGDDLVTKSVRKQMIIDNFKSLLRENFISWKIPKDYAEKLHITPNYLNAVVKELTGQSAGEHIRQRVILEAKRLLTHTDLAVTQISYELGFNDKSHFGKYFKKAENTTPDSYRKANQVTHI